MYFCTTDCFEAMFEIGPGMCSRCSVFRECEQSGSEFKQTHSSYNVTAQQPSIQPFFIS